MKTTMKKLPTRLSAVAICALLALAFATPTYADKACSASLNLKTCVSSLDPASVSYTGGTLTASGVIKALNSGGTDGHILSVVANLQTKGGADGYETIATASVPCVTGTGTLLLGKALPQTVAGRGDGLCGGADENDIAFTASFPGVSLTPGKGARLELMVTYDGATSGLTSETCGGTVTCFARVINVRFGFVVPRP